MATAAFAHQLDIRFETRHDSSLRQEFALFVLVSMVIVATAVIGQVLSAGIVAAAFLLAGLALTQASGTPLGLRRASVIGFVHWSAVIVAALGSAF